MDGAGFDVLTRTLTGAASRRGALASLLGGTLGLLGLTDTLAKGGGNKSKGGGGKKGGGKKKKKKRGPEDPRPTCDLPGFEQLCGSDCIGNLDCCTWPGFVLNGQTFGQCGKCENGYLSSDQEPCLALDPDGCSFCQTQQSRFQCEPRGNNNWPCRDGEEYSVCGVCVDGLCQDRNTGGAPREGCAGTCCPEHMQCFNGNCAYCNSFAGEEHCATNSTGPVCCNTLIGETCCNNAFCCPSDQKCCNNQFCCPKTATCCIGPSARMCCTNGAVCCPSGACAPTAGDCV